MPAKNRQTTSLSKSTESYCILDIFFRIAINFDIRGGKSPHNNKCFTQNLKTYGTFEHACTSSDNIGLDTSAVTLSVFNLARTQVFLYPWCLKI
jgi:hypothetical protein